VSDEFFTDADLDGATNDGDLDVAASEFVADAIAPGRWSLLSSAYSGCFVGRLVSASVHRDEHAFVGAGPATPDAKICTTSRVLFDIGFGRRDASEAVRAGDMEVADTTDALTHWYELLGPSRLLPPKRSDKPDISKRKGRCLHVGSHLHPWPLSGPIGLQRSPG
jgi:hypothetical protein